MVRSPHIEREDMTLEAMLGTLEATVQTVWGVAAAVSLVAHRFSHWSSYRLSLHQTWRELKLRPRSSINWMIDIFAGTSTDHKADFTFCLNAGFYLHISRNLCGWEPQAVWGMTDGNLVAFCFEVEVLGIFVVGNYFYNYLLYSAVVMSKNTCVVCCSKIYILLTFVLQVLSATKQLFLLVFLLLVHVDLEPDDNRDLQSVLSKNDIFYDEVIKLLEIALYGTDILLDLMMIKSAFHIRFNTDATSETESLLQ